jgi:hypothetical protein
VLTAPSLPSAVCLDGTPPGYHLHKGSGANANNWIVFLEEGAWCHSEENCKQRSKTNLGSSKFMKPQKFDGILSNSEQVNPDFFNWNRVFVRYCDGGSFSGNSSLPADEKVVALFTTFDSSGCICRIEELFLLVHDQGCFLSLS